MKLFLAKIVGSLFLLSLLLPACGNSDDPEQPPVEKDPKTLLVGVGENVKNGNPTLESFGKTIITLGLIDNELMLYVSEVVVPPDGRQEVYYRLNDAKVSEDNGIITLSVRESKPTTCFQVSKSMDVYVDGEEALEQANVINELKFVYDTSDHSFKMSTKTALFRIEGKWNTAGTPYTDLKSHYDENMQSK